MAVDPRITLATTKLGINATPDVNNTSDQLLVRNPETGAIDRVSKSSIVGAIPTLDQVLAQGNQSSRSIFIDDGEGNTTILASEYISLKSASGAGTWSAQAVGNVLVYSYNGTPKFVIEPNGRLLIANEDGIAGVFDPSNLTSNKTYMLPNNDGELALKEFTVPLSGTEEDKPITGNIELQDGIQLLSETDTYIAYIQPNLEGSGEFVISLMNKTNNKNSYLVFDENQVGLNLYDGVTNYGFSLVNGQVNVNLPLASRGITSTVDYTPNIQSLDFTQKKYVDLQDEKRVKVVKNSTVVGTSITGNTNENIAYASGAITGLSTGVLSIRSVLSKIGASGTATIRMYASSSPTSISGATLLGTYSTFTSTRWINFERNNILLRSGNTAYVYPPTVSSNVEGQITTAPTTVAFNTGVTNYIVITVQLVNASDSIAIEGLNIKFDKEQ